MGILFTAIFTYVGFALLLWGSLWNAKLLEKLSKAKTQWDQLRGNTPVGTTMSSPIAYAGASGSVANVDSDAEFTKLVDTGAKIIVQFSASWYDAPVMHAVSLQHQRCASPATKADIYCTLCARQDRPP